MSGSSSTWLTPKKVQRLFTSDPAFPAPRFELFRNKPSKKDGKGSNVQLLKDVVQQYKYKLMAGIILTLISASVNIYLSQLIKDLIEVMQEGKTMLTSGDVIQQFVLLQLLKLVIGMHVAKLFGGLSIQVESTIAQKLIKKTLSLSMKERYRTQES
jgi:ABC-type multidrug transport system fused ATPase/permease subunit